MQIRASILPTATWILAIALCCFLFSENRMISGLLMGLSYFSDIAQHTRAALQRMPIGVQLQLVAILLSLVTILGLFGDSLIRRSENLDKSKS